MQSKNQKKQPPRRKAPASVKAPASTNGGHGARRERRFNSLHCWNLQIEAAGTPRAGRNGSLHRTTAFRPLQRNLHESVEYFYAC
jgi:hypothetical protein